MYIVPPKRLVIVYWDDAAIDTDPFDEESDHYEHNIQISAGFLIKETPEGIVLATDLDLNSEYKEYRVKQTIPTGMIKEIKYFS